MAASDAEIVCFCYCHDDGWTNVDHGCETCHEAFHMEPENGGPHGTE